MIALAMMLAAADLPPNGIGSGEDLLKLCEADSPACSAYVQGVIDTRIISQNFSEVKKAFCLPMGIYTHQLGGVVRWWLDKHADVRNMSPSSLTIRAVGETFPCPKE